MLNVGDSAGQGEKEFLHWPMPPAPRPAMPASTEFPPLKADRPLNRLWSRYTALTNWHDPLSQAPLFRPVLDSL